MYRYVLCRGQIITRVHVGRSYGSGDAVSDVWRITWRLTSVFWT